MLSAYSSKYVFVTSEPTDDGKEGSTNKKVSKEIDSNEMHYFDIYSE